MWFRRKLRVRVDEGAVGHFATLNMDMGKNLTIDVDGVLKATDQGCSWEGQGEVGAAVWYLAPIFGVGILVMAPLMGVLSAVQGEWLQVVAAVAAVAFGVFVLNLRNRARAHRRKMVDRLVKALGTTVTRVG